MIETIDEVRQHLQAMMSYPEDCGCKHCEAGRLERSLRAQTEEIQKRARQRLMRFALSSPSSKGEKE